MFIIIYRRAELVIQCRTFSAKLFKVLVINVRIRSNIGRRTLSLLSPSKNDFILAPQVRGFGAHNIGGSFSKSFKLVIRSENILRYENIPLQIATEV